MFEKINKAKELIQEVKENIENRKESILNKAFRGELTAEWRKNNQTEDAIELLKSINEEKVKNWEQECVEAEKNGKKKPSKPKIEEIQNMIISKEEEPYKITKNWKWVKLEEIIELISGQDVSNTLCNSEGKGIPYIIGASNLNNEIFVAERWIEKPRVISKKDNILLSVKGTIGKIYLQKEEEINLSRQIMALKTRKNIFNKWLKYFLNNIINEIKEKGNGLIPGISREIILNIRTPLPPLEEQEEIVRILDEILEKENKIKELTELGEAIELLEKSILDKAFRGKLGTQNKDDEPAIELLKKYYNLK
ncbi:restriction endonuclease subunit S [Fusobacterium varium]|uniref:restriction endonuclease subunit S n=1 Tax=Fusobacterium varium TaxID=856 RepID=UPI001F2A10B5|nr:restriction endonuclease subunit S [Fusobacterium varium]MCF2673526.1 restriction endonuclease subunit S [Fusobacterium varium]